MLVVGLVEFKERMTEVDKSCLDNEVWMGTKEWKESKGKDGGTQGFVWDREISLADHPGIEQGQRARKKGDSGSGGWPPVNSWNHWILSVASR